MVKNGERSSFFKHIYELKNECENELGTFKNGEFVDVQDVTEKKKIVTDCEDEKS